MSNAFGTPITQPGFTLGTATQPAAGGPTGFAFGTAAAGAGDASKPAPAGLAQTTTQTQDKPYTQSFSATFASPKFGAQVIGTPTFGAQATGTPTFGAQATGSSTFGAQATGTPTFGAQATGTPTFGASPAGAVGFGTPASGTASFGISQQKNTTSNTPTPANTAGPGGLTLGTPIGTSTAQTAQPGQLAFQTPTAQPFGLGLGTLTTPSASPGFNFGGNNAATTTSALNFNLGGTPATSGTASTGGINFGTPKTNVSGPPTGTTATTGAGVTGLSFETGGIGGTQTLSSATGFNIPGTGLQITPSRSAAPAGSTPSASAAGGFNLSGAQPQVAQTSGTGFNLGGTTTTTPASAPATGFGQGNPASSTTFTLPSAAPTTAAPAFNSSAATPAASTSGFTLGKSIAPPTSTAPQTSAPQTSLGTATNVTSSTAATSQPGGINFCQLEESINKWTLELEEQEKAFVNQATQVNAWDRLLIANGEKIVTLNQEVERVKLEQQQLEHELDYVVGQQRELQDCLVPLEKELASVSASDPEREYTYRLAENLDTQLKQMSEDLKEIIEHLNEANRSQDSSDPIVQIGKILNAHMNSLQWLDQRTAVIQTKIQQIDQLHQNFRQEHERSFSLAYN